MRKSCRVCSGEVTMQKLGSVSGANPPLKVTTTGMPVAKCRRNHANPLDDGFMVWLIRELKDRAGNLPGGDESGMIFFKKYRCTCGAELPAKSERTHSFPLELAYEGAPAFTAELEMPVHKCAGCGKEQVRSRKSAQGHVAFAIVKLNDAAGFPHSG